jgi:protein CpxP
MKIHTKAMILGLILLGPLAAESAPRRGEPGPPGERPGSFRAEHGQHYTQERLDQLHGELKLTPAQEEAWNTWSGKINRAEQAQKEARPDFEALKQMPAPDRLQKLIDFSRVHVASMEEILAATKDFYATLNPDQRKSFDDFAPLGARAPKGMGRRGPHHPGR